MNECKDEYLFVLFNSTSHVLAAEKIIKQSGLPYKLVPVPRVLSSDCGICIRFCRKDKEKIESLLAGKIDDFRINSLEGGSE